MSVTSNRAWGILFTLLAFLACTTALEAQDSGDDFLMTPDKLKKGTEQQPVVPPQETTTPAQAESSPPAAAATDSGSKATVEAKPEIKSDTKPGTESTGAENAVPESEKKASVKPREVYIKKEKDVLSTAKWEGSLLFNENDLMVLKAARDIYTKNNQGRSDFTDDDHGLRLSDQEMAEMTKPKEVRAPVVTLDSITFFNKNKWNFRLNGRKYSVGEKPDILEVVEVGRDKITFVWQAPYLDTFFPEWRNISIVSGGKRIIKRYNNLISIDEATSRVTFSLYPNQTFIGKNMDIVEGKVLNNDGYDVIPVSMADDNQNLMDKILDAATPNKP